VLARWFPADARGPAQGLINTSMLLGGAVTPVAAAYLIDWIGWRLAFGVFAVLGVSWALAFYCWFRDDPAEHPAVNDAERRLIGAGAMPMLQEHPPVPWRLVLASANVWLLGGIITCSAFASYMYFFWYPTYLEQGRGVDAITSGWLSSLVLAGGAIGCTLGGYLGDGLVRRTGSQRWSRRLIGFGGLSGAALALLTSLAFDSALAAALLTALACLSACTTLASWWAMVTAISGHHLGTLFGLMNSLGVPGALGSQLFFGRFADVMRARGYQGRDQWDPGFFVYAAVLLVGAVGWLFVDPARSAVEGDEQGLMIMSDE
jgi:ACS family glucarate transporter-like MFS transporter